MSETKLPAARPASRAEQRRYEKRLGKMRLPLDGVEEILMTPTERKRAAKKAQETADASF